MAKKKQQNSSLQHLHYMFAIINFTDVPRQN